MNGNSTLGENIADHGGLAMSEAAYATWLEADRGRTDTRLPAAEFTNQQLFYLGYNH